METETVSEMLDANFIFREDFIAYSSYQINASSESKSQRRAMQFPQQPGYTYSHH